MDEPAKGPMDDILKNPLLSGLMLLCVLSNITALVCFALEVGMHPTSFNWIPLILTFGMFFAPRLTASGRKNQPGHIKNYYDIAFVLYGAITHWLCSFSVGYAGDSAFGCDWPEKAWDCDMGHPGIYGAFFFGIASITGHAFGWEKIKQQRMARNWLGKDDYDYYDMNDRENSQLQKLEEEVVYSFFIGLITGMLSFVCGLIHLVDDKGKNWETDAIFSKKWGIGALYLFILVVTGIKEYTLYNEVKYNPGLTRFATNEKSLLLSVVNITLFVWLTGALWYLIGLGAASEDGVYWWYIASAIISCGLAFWQHFHI